MGRPREPRCYCNGKIGSRATCKLRGNEGEACVPELNAIDNGSCMWDLKCVNGKCVEPKPDPAALEKMAKIHCKINGGIKDAKCADNSPICDSGEPVKSKCYCVKRPGGPDQGPNGMCKLRDKKGEACVPYSSITGSGSCRYELKCVKGKCV